MRISDWSSDVCSSDLIPTVGPQGANTLGNGGEAAQRLADVGFYLRWKIRPTRRQTQWSLNGADQPINVLLWRQRYLEFDKDRSAHRFDQRADRKSTRLNSSH